MRFRLLFALLLPLAACAESLPVQGIEDDNVHATGERLTTATATDKRALTAKFLFGSEPLPSALPMSAFAAPERARVPTEQRTGRLKLGGGLATGFKVIEDRFDYRRDVGNVLQSFPDTTLDWAEGDGYVVPLRQDVQRGTHPAWEVAFQPGRVWYPDNDGALRRYAMPFALVERNANCTHNGVLTWIIDSTGNASRVAFEIASETCAYLKFDMWGMLDAEYSTLPDANGALVAYQKNRNARLPVKTFDVLREQRPAINSAGFGPAGYGDPVDSTVYGFVVDGQHYRSSCPTRYGPYPFCAEILLPSFSTAKSLFGGIGLMRLEALFPGAAKTPVASLLPECARAGWNDVTIEDAVDLATGRYNDTGLEVDESAAEHVEFLYATTHREKIAFACGFFPRKSAPGKVWAYHTSDTYLAGTAMRAYLQDRLGTVIDLYAKLILPIWEALDSSAASRSTRTTYDETAQPLVGWGLSFQPDDIARIAAWLANGAPLSAGLTIDRALYAAAMQADPDDRGLQAGAANARYKTGFWGLDIAEFIACKKPVWVPFMSGHGGISVVMFPNGTAYYHFSDGYVYRWREAAIESNKIRNMCP